MLNALENVMASFDAGGRHSHPEDIGNYVMNWEDELRSTHLQS